MNFSKYMLKSLGAERVFARVTGAHYALDTALTHICKEENVRVLFTFPHYCATNGLNDRRRRSTELIALERQSTCVPGQKDLPGMNGPSQHFFLREGVHVAWGASREEILILEKSMEQFRDVSTTLSRPIEEHMCYQYRDAYEHPVDSKHLNQTGSFIDSSADIFVLENSDVLTKVPYTYALAQSVLIDAISETTHPIARDVRNWSSDILMKGNLAFDIRKLRCQKARIMLVCMNSLSGKALDKPSFFWSPITNSKMPHLESLYVEAQEYLEIERRKYFLQEHLGHILATMEFLRCEHHALLSHRLEWIIILLISVEVILGLRSLLT